MLFPILLGGPKSKTLALLVFLLVSCGSNPEVVTDVGPDACWLNESGTDASSPPDASECGPFDASVDTGEDVDAAMDASEDVVDASEDVDAEAAAQDTGAGQAPVILGASSTFAILASAQITNIPTSMITGDVGLTPDAGSNIIGFAAPLTCPEVTGHVYAVDATGPACALIDAVLLANAKSDAEAAFLDARAAARGTPTSISGNLNGLTLYPGLYESLTSIEISPGGILYLDAQGDGNAVFILRSETSIHAYPLDGPGTALPTMQDDSGRIAQDATRPATPDSTIEAAPEIRPLAAAGEELECGHIVVPLHGVVGNAKHRRCAVCAGGTDRGMEEVRRRMGRSLDDAVAKALRSVWAKEILVVRPRICSAKACLCRAPAFFYARA